MFRLRVFDLYEGFSQTVLGPIYRRVGKHLAQKGLAYQLPNTSDDRIVPSLRRIALSSSTPQVAAVNSTLVRSLMK